MGLGFSHGNAHWSYSGFMQFRIHLAESIGIKLADMDGYRGERLWSTVHDDIVPLLQHSDSEGVLTHEECARVAPRLREILRALTMFQHDVTEGMCLVRAMEECAQKGVPLEFC